MIKLFIILVVSALLVGCGSWDSVSSPNIKGSNAMSSVLTFVGTNGWAMRTNESGINWSQEPNAKLIRGLPWRSFRNKDYKALTQDGILYVVLDYGFHHDYSGVAYNPNTNRFPWFVRGFKPIGDHWYVWAQPEFLSITLDQQYE